MAEGKKHDNQHGFVTQKYVLTVIGYNLVTVTS